MDTVKKWKPNLGEVYLMDQPTLLHILDGVGSIQVDFHQYDDWEDKLIFLDKGQYIRFMQAGFLVRKIIFPADSLFKSKDVRVLFKHLVSLGYINFRECLDCQRFLEQGPFHGQLHQIIDISSEQWYWQNPFQAKREEYQLIFNVKEVIDEVFREWLTNSQLVQLLQAQGYTAQALVQDKVGLSVKGLLQNRRLLEGQRLLAFSDKSMKEVAFALGYQDPSYFSRAFRKATQQTPQEFREGFDGATPDLLMQDLMDLLQEHHAEQRSASFYADKLHLSVKTLSKQVQTKLQTTLGQLIREHVVNHAKLTLKEDLTVVEVALRLGFDEPQHFSRFFKHYTGLSPSDFRKQKYQG